MRLAIQLS